MAIYRATGVVLRTYKLGESDRIIVLLTRERGLVRAVARGVRKTTSKFGARLEPASVVAVQLYEGRELHHVSQAETIEQFPSLRVDLDRWGRAAALLEVMSQIGREGDESSELTTMLVGGLRAIEKWDSPLVVAAFFLKLLAYEGVGLDFSACTRCGTTEGLVALDIADGGVRCEQHRSGRSVSPSAVRLMSMITSGQLVAALEADVDAATWEVDHLATEAIESLIERRLRSVRTLEHGA